MMHSPLARFSSSSIFYRYLLYYSHFFSVSLLQRWMGFYQHAGPVIQFLLSSIFSSIFSLPSSVIEGHSLFADGQRGRSICSVSHLFSFITFSRSFLGEGNLISRAITFGGHLSPVIYEGCYRRRGATVREGAGGGITHSQ